jgi:hypothetical protein
VIDLASRPENRGAFLTQRVAKDAAKTQRLNSLPQFHVLWVIRSESAPRTNGPYPRCLSPANGCSGWYRTEMERERPLEERRRASDLSRTVERHRQAKCCQSNGLTFYRDGVLLTHDGTVFTITSRLKQPHLKASCRYRGDCAQSPPG